MRRAAKTPVLHTGNDRGFESHPIYQNLMWVSSNGRTSGLHPENASSSLVTLHQFMCRPRRRQIPESSTERRDGELPLSHRGKIFGVLEESGLPHSPVTGDITRVQIPYTPPILGNLASVERQVYCAEAGDKCRLHDRRPKLFSPRVGVFGDCNRSYPLASNAGKTAGVADERRSEVRFLHEV